MANLPVPQIVALFKECGIEVSRYVVNQMKKARNFKERSFVKVLTLKDVKDRNAQFEIIKKVRGVGAVLHYCPLSLQ